MTKQEAMEIARNSRKFPPVEDIFWGKVERAAPEECWPWKGYINPDGYGYFRGKGKAHLASKWAWLLTFGEVPKGLVVCHHCDNPPCCNPRHLFIGEPQHNVDDCVSKGRHVKGSRCMKRVLTEDMVTTLRRRASEVGIRSASEEMGIKYATATYACNRGWRHV